MNNRQVTSRAPLIVAIIMLLLPVLYVGSYLALVVPGGIIVEPMRPINASCGRMRFSYYRIYADWPNNAFWPLEQIDRKLRPVAWK